jgi:hypothetical protein
MIRMMKKLLRNECREKWAGAWVNPEGRRPIGNKTFK